MSGLDVTVTFTVVECHQNTLFPYYLYTYVIAAIKKSHFLNSLHFFSSWSKKINAACHITKIEQNTESYRRKLKGVVYQSADTE